MAYNGDYLIHYGVMGMRWGVRKKEYRKGPPKRKAKKDSTKKKGLPTAAKIAIGVGVGAAALAIGYYGGRRIAEILTSPQSISEGKKIVEQVSEKIPNTPPKRSFRDISNKVINPTKNTTNCISCSAATVMNMKGFDVRATTHEPETSIANMASSVFKNPKIEIMPKSSKRRLTDHCLQQGDGAYGIISSYYRLSPFTDQKMGHAYNYMVQDGKVHFFDKQSDPGLLERFINQLDKFGLFDESDIIRADNLEVNTDAIDNVAQRWVVTKR